VKSYLSTPIYYVNGSPHLGHAHTSVMADILCRHQRLLGNETLLSTGCDEHGQKNEAAAEESGMTPQEYLDERSAEFRRVFDKLNVEYDMFVRTSRPEHHAAVVEVAARLHKEGYLVKKQYTGIYCTGCEQFKKETDLNEDGRCPDHPNLEPEQLDETNYFFKIEPFRQQLIDHINENPEFVTPDQYRNELLQMLSEPLEDRCISRPKHRVKLGVTLPFDTEYVAYVWFDALINYISNIGWPDPKSGDWWPHASHLIGKDILKTHGVYWPAMLFGLEMSLPNRLIVHGHWLGAGGIKMSKTLGNVVNPEEVVEELGADALRYYLARNMRVGGDSQISVDLVKTAYNAELGNKIGNLFSRAAKFAFSRFDEKLPEPGALSAEDEAVRAIVLAAANDMTAPLELSDLPQKMKAIVGAADELNEYFTAQAPWTLVKSEDTIERAKTSVYVTLDCLRLIFEMMSSVIPTTSENALGMLSAPLSKDAAWVPQLDGLKGGTQLKEIATLFPRAE